MPRKRKGTEQEQQERDRCNKIRQMLRRAWSKDVRRYDCLKENRRKYEGPNKRQRYEHQCNICKEWYKQDQVQIDHVVACGAFTLAPESLGAFVLRMFEGELQKLCSTCHKIKSKQENDERRKVSDTIL